MKKISLTDVENYVNENIGAFHENRVNILKKIKLNQVLQKKNPYLFKAKNLLTAERLVESVLQAYLSSSEEELFGEFLEELAIFIASKTLGGRKAHGSGIDLEFKRSKVIYLVSIKSGVNWGNSSQYKALRDNFKKAVQILKQSKSIKTVQPVLASCYGKRKTIDNGEYLKICGQEFWYFISGNRELYTDIIEPIGHHAKEHNQHYEEERAVLINKFTAEFSSEFCVDGRIDWKKLVQFNSGNSKMT
ncbi:MAG: cytosolic protein [Ignavibacteriae bacterium]|nr:MAG: cytosolic protein [Ignavibacteriota bacterium]